MREKQKERQRRDRTRGREREREWQKDRERKTDGGKRHINIKSSDMVLNVFLSGLFFFFFLLFFCFFVKLHINLRGQFNAKFSMVEEQLWYYLTQNWEDKDGQTFPKRISLENKRNCEKRIRTRSLWAQSDAFTSTPCGLSSFQHNDSHQKTQLWWRF